MSMKVAVLEGGRSLERGVSLRTGGRVKDALERLGHEAISLDADTSLISNLRAHRPDVAFIALHGRDGEDGTVQQILDLLGIPHTGSDVGASARTADKSIAKRRLIAAGLPTPDFFVLDDTAVRDLAAVQLVPEIGERLGWPMIIKPALQGSALGLTLVRGEADVPAALLSALSYDSRILFERHVEGRDLAVTVLVGPEGAEALPAVEAIPEGDRYDFEARYEIGATRFECPAKLTAEQSGQAANLAERAVEALECSGFPRVDLILAENGEMTILEVDTVPGLTQTSLVPLACGAKGIDFDSLIAKMLELAVGG
ncbi:MAG: D-alanine--D-alanine ligase [Solirubrobacterales bacterium]|nr:D-alanine--D-alanine ligase [Solirubrobacterales bacterium]